MTKKSKTARLTTAPNTSTANTANTTNGNAAASDNTSAATSSGAQSAQTANAGASSGAQANQAAQAKKTDHQKVKNWLKQYKAAKTTEQRDRLAENIYNELSSTPHHHEQERTMARDDYQYGRYSGDEDDRNYRRGNQQRAGRYAGDDDYRGTRGEPSRDSRGRYIDTEDYGEAARRATEGRREYQGTTGRNYYESDYDTSSRWAREEGDYGAGARHGWEDQGSRGQQYAQQNRYGGGRQQNASYGGWDEDAQFENQGRSRNQDRQREHRDQYESQGRYGNQDRYGSQQGGYGGRSQGGQYENQGRYGNQDRYGSQQQGGYGESNYGQYENQGRYGSRGRQQGSREEFRDSDDRLRRSRSLSGSSRSSTDNNTWLDDDTDYTSTGPRM